MFRARVRAGLDPAHVGIRVCGYVHEHPGLDHAVENDVGYGEGNGREFDLEREVVNGAVSRTFIELSLKSMTERNPKRGQAVERVDCVKKLLQYVQGVLTVLEFRELGEAEVIRLVILSLIKLLQGVGISTY